MKQQYIVAGNAFTVSTPDDGLAVWRTLDSQYGPFEVSPAVKNSEVVLQIDIRVDSLPDCDATTIYEPEHARIGLVESRASRMADGCFIFEFSHIADGRRRIWMKMPPELNRAEVILTPEGDSDDPYFVTHAVMIAYLLATGGNGTIVIHASVVTFAGKAYLFQGKSGTGKSTHAALWTQNIAGAELLNDDHPVIRFVADGVVKVYGSPWSGKTPCYRNISAEVGAFVRIVRGDENELRRLSPLTAYASLTSSVFFLPFFSDKAKEVRHKTIELLAMTTPCCEMHCRPDADAALTCLRELSTYGAESSGFPKGSTK